MLRTLLRVRRVYKARPALLVFVVCLASVTAFAQEISKMIGAEVDMQCFVCRGGSVEPGAEPCRTCSSEGWIELGGCGMVNPRVLVACDDAQVRPGPVRDPEPRRCPARVVDALGP